MVLIRGRQAIIGGVNTVENKEVIIFDGPSFSRPIAVDLPLADRRFKLLILVTIIPHFRLKSNEKSMTFLAQPPK